MNIVQNLLDKSQTQSSSPKSINMTTGLVSSLLSQQTPTSTSTTTTSQPKNTYKKYKNKVVTGVAIGDFKNVSESECEEKCDANTKCKGYAYDTKNKRCYLKSSTKTINRSGFNAGVKSN